MNNFKCKYFYYSIIYTVIYTVFIQKPKADLSLSGTNYVAHHGRFGATQKVQQDLRISVTRIHTKYLAHPRRPFQKRLCDMAVGDPAFLRCWWWSPLKDQLWPTLDYRTKGASYGLVAKSCHN